jgi:hypothetical protein
MSVQPGQSSSGQPAGSEERRFSTLIGSLAAATPSNRGDGADETGVEDSPQATAAKPTFTARASGPAIAVTPEPADDPELDSSGSRVRRASAPAPAAVPAPATVPDPATAGPAAPAPAGPASSSPALQDAEATRILPRPAATMDEPLISDVAGLRARWQRVQASFVDDPPEAVGAAADLIEQTAQSLVSALRQRQRQLREMREHGPDQAPDGGEAAARAADTEHLRLMMQRYRALFNQLCRP